MVKNIIFDFGDVFINLDKQVVFNEITSQGYQLDLLPEIQRLNALFEIGALSASEFIVQLGTLFPKVSSDRIISVWNAMLLDFPEYRLDFIERLAYEKEYRLFLLSNTNDLHITHVEKLMGSVNYRRFKSFFEQFYLSHEIGLRKPDSAIYEFVLQENGLQPSETLFIDDTKDNTDAAAKLGIKTWNLLVGKDDVIHLKSKL